MARFGFCISAGSDLDSHVCKGEFKDWHIGKVSQGRKKVDGVVFTGETIKCDCLCHIPEDERPKPVRKRTAKKATAKKPVKKTAAKPAAKKTAKKAVAKKTTRKK